MSEATLKKKILAKNYYSTGSSNGRIISNSHSMSAGSTNGFSLNGVHRSQGYIGQTSLSRHYPRTLARGTGLRGHGGCCGTFPIRNASLDSTFTTEDATSVKSSVLDYDGMIATKHRWLRRPQGYGFVVKSDVNQNYNTQSNYISYLSKQCNAIEDTESDKTPTKKYLKSCQNNAFSLMSCSVTKDSRFFTSISQGEYMSSIHKKCSVLDENSFSNPKTVSGQPILKNSCFTSTNPLVKTFKCKETCTVSKTKPINHFPF